MSQGFARNHANPRAWWPCVVARAPHGRGTQTLMAGSERSMHARVLATAESAARRGIPIGAAPAWGSLPPWRRIDDHLFVLGIGEGRLEDGDSELQGCAVEEEAEPFVVADLMNTDRCGLDCIGRRAAGDDRRPCDAIVDQLQRDVGMSKPVHMTLHHMFRMLLHELLLLLLLGPCAERGIDFVP